MSKWIGLDIETTWCPMKELKVITIADPEPRIVYSFIENSGIIPPDVIELLNSSSWIVHNAWFDVGVLSKYGIVPTKLWCTMAGEMLISNATLQPSLKGLVSKYCKVTLDKDEQKSDWSQVLTESQIEYCLNDVRYLHEIYERQLAYHKRKKSITHVELKNELIRSVAGDLNIGFPIDRRVLAEVADESYAEYTVAVKEFCSKIPASLFLRKNISVKAFVASLSPICPEVAGFKKHPQVEEFKQSDKFESVIKELFTIDPENDIFITPTSSGFADRVAELHNVKLDSYDKKSLAEYVRANPNSEFTKIINLIVKTRTLLKLHSTFGKLDKYETFTLGDDFRLRLKPTFTATGRIGLQPMCVLPRETDDDAEYSYIINKIRKMYVPPKGYKTIDLDYSSVEDVIAGVLYNDPGKLSIIDAGLDQYLKFTSVLFGNFKYDSPEQTAQLKKDYKELRQAMKGMALAGNYGASAFKFGELFETAFKGIELEHIPSGDEIYDKWGELYPKLREAHKYFSSTIAGWVNDIYKSYDLDKETLSIIKTKDRIPTSDVNRVREDILRDSGCIANIGSILGLQRVFRMHYDFRTSFFGCRSVKITDICNHPIQTTGAEILSLAIIMIKKAMPQVQIGAFIHDSIIAFAHESEDLEAIKEQMIKIMGAAGWCILGRHLKVDGKILDRGF